MPGTLPERHVLDDLPVATDERMRRGAQALDLLEVWVRIPRQRAGEEPIDPRAAELPGRQADAVHDEELGRRARWPLVEMGRQHLAGAGEQARGGIDPQSL